MWKKLYLLPVCFAPVIVMVFTGEAAIVFSFVTTRGKTYSIAWISHGLDVSVILLTKSFNLWYSGHELICCCCYSLAKLHNSLQLVECAPTNHSQRVVFSTNHEKNKNQSLWPAVSRWMCFLQQSIRTAARCLTKVQRRGHILSGLFL